MFSFTFASYISLERFAGSDISFFTNFEAYWGPTERSLIETTYRLPRSIVDVSSTFVLKNTAQVEKKLRTVSSNDSFCFAIIQSNSDRFVGTDLKAKLGVLPPGSSVFLIGRYNQDITPFLSDDLQIRNDIHTERRIITYSQRKDLQIEFMSAHKSKGLQADYVFIINNRNERLGFPSNIQDDRLLELVLEKKEEYSHAEERRLFYVAMIRARKFVWFVAIKDKKSIFLSEIERTYGEKIKDEARKCPSCNSGRLVYRKGQYGTFWGCSNYPDCKHTQKAV